MGSKKALPFIPEDVLKIQRVEIYLKDLKERLNELCMQHDEVIHSSVEMIKEIDQVSSTLLSTSGNATAGENMTKIKKLILEFESAKETCNKQTPVVLETHIDVPKILHNFEKLSKSHFLKDSLIFLRKARESLEKIDTCLGAGLIDMKKVHISESIRDKIKLLNPIKDHESEATAIKLLKPNENVDETIVLDDKDNKDKTETISNYASCCSSLASLPMSKNSLNGYEGDNDDSEFDIIPATKKRN